MQLPNYQLAAVEDTNSEVGIGYNQVQGCQFPRKNKQERPAYMLIVLTQPELLLQIVDKLY